MQQALPFIDHFDRLIRIKIIHVVYSMVLLSAASYTTYIGFQIK